MTKLLATGKTDLLDKFVSMRTRRAVQGLPGLGRGSRQGELRVRAARRSSRRARARRARPRRRATGGEVPRRQGRREARSAAKAPREEARRRRRRRRPRPRRRASTGAGLKPSAALAAVIGTEPVPRTQVIKKLWDYIKANGLQDATNKRAINADAKLLPVFGKPQVTMFELAGHRRQAPELIAMTLNHLNLTVTDPVETSQFLAKYNSACGRRAGMAACRCCMTTAGWYSP